MAYLPYILKWRPQTFDQVVGQEHITTTLKNAISLNRVAHTYLFTGPRGIGKTSCARIFAKALNCEKGPTPEPCNKCTSCKEITEGRSLDIIEIDGASNRGIEEVRNLRENVKFASVSGRFKIYIIDEVHMVTPDAFNAFLKTLEEPPSHVKFIFATTQPYKVLNTILSRCQRFDFRRIPIKDTISQLEDIAQEEKLKVSKEALFSIARASDGSMRDAESILDQLASVRRGKIELDDVTSTLGVVSQEALFEIAKNIIDTNSSSALTQIDKIANSGKDLTQFIVRLIGHFRDLMVIKTGKELYALVDLPKETIEELSKQAEALSMQELFYILDVLSNTQKTMRGALSLRIPLEMAVVKLTQREKLIPLSELLKRISDLETNLEGNFTQRESEKNIPEENTNPPEEKINPPQDLSVPETLEEPSQETEQEPTVIFRKSEEKDLTMEKVNDIWPELLKIVRLEKISLASYLLEGTPIGVRDNEIIIGFPEKCNLHREVLEKIENKKLIRKILIEILKDEVNISFVSAKHLPGVKLPEEKPQASPQKPKPPGKEGASEPIIRSAMDIFGGSVKDPNRK